MPESITTMLRSEPTRLGSAYENVRELLLTQRVAAGHWIGELSASSLSTATAISTLAFALDAAGTATFHRDTIQHQIRSGVRWLIRGQNGDGGWGDTDKSYSNIATTMLVMAALNASGRATEFADEIERAQLYVDAEDGIHGIRDRYAGDKTFAVPILANCAMAGMVPWREVSPLPFEAACVPQRFYHLLRLPVVSYAIPALVAIGQVKFKHDPPWNPVLRWIRSLSVQRSLNVLEKMQPASGGYLEAVPLTSFVSMALIKSGRFDHPVVQNGIRFIIQSFRADPDDESCGSWPIDTNLATWVTTLSINALTESGGDCVDWHQPRWRCCIQWILDCQYQNVHPFTAAEPGGWGWSDLSGAVPDADDTPGALLALKRVFQRANSTDLPQAKILQAAQSGVDWLLKLQNRDKGWPTFCRGWGRLPFDRSGTDITAHVIRALFAWRSELSNNRIRSQKLQRAIESGFRYIQASQLNDGSWLPLWFGNQDQDNDVNPCYGTAKVLMAYRDTGRFDTKPAENGLNWLLRQQNSDGGWGGGASVSWSKPEQGNSTIEETALCTDVMVSAGDLGAGYRTAATRGLDWLMTAVECGEITSSWPIGFYFAKLWYYERLYPLIFTTSALGQALKHQGSANNRGGEDA